MLEQLRLRCSARLFPVAVGFLLLATAACHNPISIQPPPPPTVTCDQKSQNGVSTLTSSASTSVGASQFSATYTRSLAISPTGTPSGMESHFVLQRNVPGGATSPPPALQADTQISLSGSVQVMMRFGDGFSGIKEIVFTSSDNKTLQGTIDGKEITPYSLKSDPKSIKFADGSALTQTTVDSDVLSALPLLSQAMKNKCGAGAPAAEAPSPAPPPGQPAHPINPTRACIICTATFALTYDACVWGAAQASTSCGLFYPVCLAAATLVCLGAEGVELGTLCHLPPFAQIFGQTPGPPCCPVYCGGNSCCNTGESCASAGLCCSAGTTVCGSNCCNSGETCVGGATCCSNGSVCGSNCCGAGQSCTSGVCCPTGNAVCNGVCCGDPNDICDPNTHACTLACPGGCQPGQLCCTAGGTGAPVCTSQLGPRNGHPWCGESAPNQIYCNNCPQGQTCTSICSGGLCSTELYCQ